MLRREAVALALVAALLAYLGLRWWRTKNVSAVQRGFTVAQAKGCFACHGPGGVTGREDPGGGVGGVPAFSREDLESYAKNEEEIREWILDGMPQRVRQEAGAMKPQDLPLIRMPAWREILSGRETDDLVAYVKAVSDFEAPSEEKAEAGREAAARLGCFGCHGPQGRGGLPNPRSFKGYIPSWDGPDFPDLATGDAEVREWILDGRPKRLQANPLARFFFDRQVIQMPAFRGRIPEEDLDRIVHYIRWLRRKAS